MGARQVQERTPVLWRESTGSNHKESKFGHREDVTLHVTSKLQVVSTPEFEWMRFSFRNIARDNLIVYPPSATIFNINPFITPCFLSCVSNVVERKVSRNVTPRGCISVAKVVCDFACVRCRTKVYSFFIYFLEWGKCLKLEEWQMKSG